MLLALQLVDDTTDPLSGLPLAVVTDPANRYNFVTHLPRTNWAAHTLAEDQKTYYAKHDTDKDHPMNRAGHMWRVVLKDDPPTE